MDDNHDTRDSLGELFCKGEGIEIGPGLLPTKVAADSVVHYVDKRTPDELKTYFGTKEIINVQDLNLLEGKSFDFVIAHHVLEHSANVIHTLINWMCLLKDGGVLFLSLPNKHITPDGARLITPPTHFLLDYLTRSTEDDFESREHICSFLWSWIDVGGLEGKSKIESAGLVSNSVHNDVNDLHWHTFNVATVKFVVEMAAAFKNRSINLIFERDGFPVKDEHRVIFRIGDGAGAKSSDIAELLTIKETLRPILYRVALAKMEGKVTYSLSKKHKGKLFLVEGGRLRWIKSPETLRDRGLDIEDYTYLEISDVEEGIMGQDIEP